MAYRIIYVDDARNDVREARVWYKKQRQGLEKNFSIAIQNAIYRIGHNPYVFAIRYRNIRIIHTETFPFGIHFFIDEVAQQIIITAVMHDYRDIQFAED